MHGKNNYLNMSTLVCYMFYKNMLVASTPLCYTFVTGLSGSKMSPEFALQMFNAVWTAFPILFLGILDQQVPRRIAKLVPQLYEVGLHRKAFNGAVLATWALTGICEAVCLVFFSIYSLQHLGEDGTDFGMWALGQAVMTYALTTANLKLLTRQYSWNWMHVLILFLSITLWWPSAWLASSTIVTTNQFVFVMVQGQLGVFEAINALPAFWLVLMLLVVMFIVCELARTHLPRLFCSDLLTEVLTAYQAGKSDLEIAAIANAVPLQKFSAGDGSFGDVGCDGVDKADAAGFVTLYRNAEGFTATAKSHVDDRTILGLDVSSKAGEGMYIDNVQRAAATAAANANDDLNNDPFEDDTAPVQANWFSQSRPNKSLDMVDREISQVEIEMGANVSQDPPS